MSNENKNSAKPFLKWAGGKTQLLDDIINNLPKDLNSNFNKYFEPFVGGGAVFFRLISEFDFDAVYLGDTNGDLIVTYNIIQNNHEKLIDELKLLSKEYLEANDKKGMFEKKREKFNKIHCTDSKIPKKNHLEIASKMIFLNKTCFNGLYRVNKKGEFNVPFAHPKKPLICDEENIINVHNVLSENNVTIKCQDYSKWRNLIDRKSFVYFDPPYRPINGKKSFEGYSKSAFNDANQEELAEFCDSICKDAKFLLSNSDPKENNGDMYFEDLYCKKYNFNTKSVYAKRFINSNAKKRGPISELLVSNYVFP